MAGIYQATGFFNLNGKGWSESYYRESGALTTLEQLTVFDKALWDKRALMLGSQCQFVARRVSFISVKGDSLTVYDARPVGNFNAEDAATALLTRCTDTETGKTKMIFFRGIADECVAGGGQFVEQPAAFINALNTFTDYLKEQGYGWMGVSAKVETDLVDYTQNADGTVNVVGGAGTFGAGPWPLPERVRFKKANGPLKSQLNQRLVVNVVNATTCNTVAQIAVLPRTAASPGKIVRWTPALHTINNVFYVKIGERRTGKVYGVPRGRVPNRART